MKPNIVITPTSNEKYVITVDAEDTYMKYSYDTIEEAFEHVLSLFSEKPIMEVGVRTATNKNKAEALKAWKYHRG